MTRREYRRAQITECVRYAPDGRPDPIVVSDYARRYGVSVVTVRADVRDAQLAIEAERLRARLAGASR